MTPCPLVHADDPARFGGKAAALARALRAGLPVPDGWAVEHDLVEAIAGGDAGALRALAATLAGAPGPYAVRSSAVGEDGAGSSFAGQHLTRLGVAPDAVAGALAEVRDSVHAPAALAYRARRGIVGAPSAGVVIQRLVDAEVAAVVFTRDPVSGADRIVVEAALGLGESVVSGAVVPDRFVIDRDGRVLERLPGDKDTALLLREGRPVQVAVEAALRTALCLDDRRLAQVHALVAAADAVWPPPHDLEIAFRGADVYLLQRRPLTGTVSRPAR